MKNISVVAAIIKRETEEGLQFFATQRGYGDYKGWWEFPGGKIEDGETPEEALFREIREELEIDIVIDSLFHSVEYDYPEFHLYMNCYLCHIARGEIILREHETAKWLSGGELDSVNWLPADLEVIDIIKDMSKQVL